MLFFSIPNTKSAVIPTGIARTSSFTICEFFIFFDSIDIVKDKNTAIIDSSNMVKIIQTMFTVMFPFCINLNCCNPDSVKLNDIKYDPKLNNRLTIDKIIKANDLPQ